MAQPSYKMNMIQINKNVKIVFPILKSSEELSKKVVCEEWFESAEGTKLHPSSSLFIIGASLKV